MNSTACCDRSTLCRWLSDKGLSPRQAQRDLHQRGIEPAAVFAADIFADCRRGGSRRQMQADRRRLRRVADDGDHLPEAACRRGFHQRFEQHKADAAPMHVGRDIDRILDGLPIGRARRGKARHRHSRRAGRRSQRRDREIRLPAVWSCAAPSRFRPVAQFKRGRAVFDRMRVDAGDGRYIGGIGGADHGIHAFVSVSKNKTPGHEARAFGFHFVAGV